MQLPLNLDEPVESVSPAKSLARSKAARRDGYKLADSHQALVVLAAIKQASEGLTRHEIAAKIGIPLSSVCGRVNELLHADNPKVYVAAFRRDGRSVLIARC
jgi:IclR helix-turn-helix domain